MLDTETSVLSGNKPRLINKFATMTSRGMLSKGWYDVDGKLCLVKGNTVERSKDSIIITEDYEPIAEVLVSNLLDILGVPHVKYWLEPCSNFPEVKSNGELGVVSVCESYQSSINYLESFTFSNYVNYRFKQQEYDYWGAVTRYTPTLKQDIFLMLHVDAIVGNASRHLNNWDILLDFSGEPRMAPLLDFGAALLSWEHGDLRLDDAAPFKYTHQAQIRLITKEYHNKLGDSSTFGKWLEMSEETLQLLSDKRRKIVEQYLKNRLERYSEI